MTKITINQMLTRIQTQLDLSSETEQELLREIRDHLEDSVADARAGGTSEEVAILKAAEKFGVTEVGPALREVHLGWESADAIVACMLPVLGALVLRWLAFAPDGSALGWQAVFARPALWIVAVAVLLIPFLQFRRWRYALVVWGLFWILSLIFMIFPAAAYWQEAGKICIYPC